MADTQLPRAQVVPPVPQPQPTPFPTAPGNPLSVKPAYLLVYRAAAFSIANTFTFTTIPFDAIEYPVVTDVQNYNRTSGVYTVLRGPLLRITAEMIFSAGAGSVGLQAVKNGTIGYRIDTGYNGGGNPGVSGSRLIPVAAGDTIVLQLAQNTPTNPAGVFAGAGLCWAQFEVVVPPL